MTTAEQLIAQAIDHLRQARDLAKAADAPRLTAKIRRALTSAGGARRNARVRAYRDDR